MQRTLLYVLAATAMVVMVSGCRARGRVRVVAPRPTVVVRGQVPASPPQPSLSVRVGTPVLSAGVTVMNTTCHPNAVEVCNGLDDNCNGVIDEGCGYQTGNIQVTLGWNTGADLDLYVTDPYGHTISYQNRQSPSGGVLDHDARGACNPGQANNTIENVYWNTPQPPSGQYRIEVHYWGECRVADVTQATLSIAVGGQVIGAYNVVLRPRERQPVAVFNLP